MCGLVGFAGDLFLKDREVFKELLYHDVVRGKDSTGIAVCKGGSFSILKQASPSYLFLQNNAKKIDSLVELTSKAILGHNRAATQGAVTDANAHPFIAGDLVGTHNGTLTVRSFNDLDPLKKYDTDSEAIYQYMNKYGFQETFDKLDGAWALVWYDSNTEELNFIRNEKRPLFYALAGSLRNKIYWSSEKGLLEWVLSRHDVPHDPAKLLPVNEHMTIQLKDVRKSLVLKKRTVAKIIAPFVQQKKEKKKPALTIVGGTTTTNTPTVEAPPELDMSKYDNLSYRTNTELNALVTETEGRVAKIVSKNEGAFKALSAQPLYRLAVLSNNQVKKIKGILLGIQMRREECDFLISAIHKIKVTLRNREAVARTFKEKKQKTSSKEAGPWTIAALDNYETLANAFFGDPDKMLNFIEKSEGCGICGETSPFHIDCKKSYVLDNLSGAAFACDSCAKQEDTIRFYIEPYGRKVA